MSLRLTDVNQTRPANRFTQRRWSPMGSTGGRNPHQSQPEVLEWIWLKFVTKNSTEIQVSQNVEDVESFKRSQQHFSLLANTFQSLFHLLLNNKSKNDWEWGAISK